MTTGHVILIIGIVFLAVAVIGGSIGGILLARLKKNVSHQIDTEYK